MGKVQQYKRGLSAFISSDRGQRFFNFAYSIGAAIVIWGALFKILHLPGGSALLSIGMGTEVLMFILSAFDRPPRDYQWEDVFPALRKEEKTEEEAEKAEAEAMAMVNGMPVQGGTVIIGGGAYHGEPVPEGMSVSAPGSTAGGDDMPDVAGSTRRYLDQMATLIADMEQLHATTQALNKVSETLLTSYKAITENSEDISESSRGYVEQMQQLHRNIGGLNTIYDLQLRSVSSQIDSIDRVNRGIKDIRDMYEKSASQSARYCEETEKMARYMQQLNSVYERMIHAMTVNMYRTAPAAAPTAAPEPANLPDPS